MDAAALAMRAGQIDDNEFVRRTAPTWRLEAGRLYARWRRRLPAWVEASDVEQEMVLQALVHVRKWDPAVGSRIGPHVIWCSIKRAQRKINHWRGASLHGDASKNASHFEVAASQAFSRRPDEEEEVEIGTRVPVRDEDPVERREAEERFEDVLQSCETVREAIVLLALRACGGSMKRAAEQIYANVHARARCGLTDRQHARRVVGGAVHSICEAVERGIISSANAA